MAEWSIAAVLKTVEPRGSWGSNPYLSAINIDNQCFTKQAPKKEPIFVLLGAFLFNVGLPSKPLVTGELKKAVVSEADKLFVCLQGRRRQARECAARSASTILETRLSHKRRHCLPGIFL